jgi:hypothetical protein
MARHQPPRYSDRTDEQEDQKVTFCGERNIISLGDSLAITIPKKALDWTLEDTDIQGRSCEVTLKSDGTYSINLSDE